MGAGGRVIGVASFLRDAVDASPCFLLVVVHDSIARRPMRLEATAAGQTTQSRGFPQISPKHEHSLARSNWKDSLACDSTHDVLHHFLTFNHLSPRSVLTETETEPETAFQLRLGIPRPFSPILP